jgi:amidase
MGGSIRNPSSFNNVVGLRPSPGRVPRYPNEQPWDTLAVLGPMARTVQDVALLLSVMAGPDRRDPISIPESPESFQRSLERNWEGTRIAWSRDLGQLPVQETVIQTIEDALPHFRELGCRIEEAHPDFAGAADIFQVLRAKSFAFGLSREYQTDRNRLKDTIVWNVEQGRKLSGLDISRAEAERGKLFQRVQAFLERYDYLLLPVSQVVPFPIHVEWVEEIEGHAMETYVDWMMSCALITLTAHPAMSVPCGFTPDGLPVGVQIVGRYRRELDLLRLAFAFEQATRVGERHPRVAMGEKE